MKKKIAIAAVSLMVVAGIFGSAFNAKAEHKCETPQGYVLCLPAQGRYCFEQANGNAYLCLNFKPFEKLEAIVPSL